MTTRRQVISAAAGSLARANMTGYKSMRRQVVGAHERHMGGFGLSGKPVRYIAMEFVTPKSLARLRVIVEVDEEERGDWPRLEQWAKTYGHADILHPAGHVIQSFPRRKCSHYIGVDDHPEAGGNGYPSEGWARRCALKMQAKFKSTFLQVAGLPSNTPLLLSSSKPQYKKGTSVASVALNRWRATARRQAEVRRQSKPYAVKALSTLPPNMARKILKTARM
jgi:hypothetical protein